MKIITLLFILFLFNACQKHKEKLNDHLNFVGNYEWYHSYSLDSNDSESYQSTSDRYGIRIKKNGKLEFYTNGDLVYKGYVSEVYDSSLTINYNKILRSIQFTGDDFILYNYPFVGHTNQFKKHD